MTSPDFSGLTMFVGVIEWPSDSGMDLDVFADRTMSGLRGQIRQLIEGQFGATVDEFLPEVREYVDAHRGDDTPFDEWYGAIHDLDTSPWVTTVEREV